MLFSCTQKVIRKIGKNHPILPEKVAPHFRNWYADALIVDRKFHVLFCHAQTFYTCIAYLGRAQEIRDWEPIFSIALFKQMSFDFGRIDPPIERVLPPHSTFTFNRTNSRQVLGIMNEYKRQMAYEMMHHGGLREFPFGTAHRCNTLPHAKHGYQNALQVMLQRLSKPEA